MSIYTELKAAGVELDHHESDLYAKVTPESEAIVEELEIKHRCNRFRYIPSGELWYEIPFAFDPFWDKCKPSKAEKILSSTYYAMNPNKGV